MFPTRIWDGPKQEKCLYLTFDDGPIPEVTPWVLEQLRKYDAKATFFCIGDNIRKHPEVFKKVVSEGHAVGNHTFNHLNGWKTPTPEYLVNAKAGQEIMDQQLRELDFPNTKTPLLRPPYGKIRTKQANALEKEGYKIVMWDVLSLDYDQQVPAEQCYENVVKNSENGSIIVFHDSLKAEKNLKAALPEVLEYFSDQGYNFKSL